MRTIKKIGVVISVAMSMGVVNIAHADAIGDSMIFSPENTSTIDGTSTDIWFTKDETALAYSLTLVNIGDASATLDEARCNTGMIAAIADPSLVQENTLIMANTLSCDSESQLTLDAASIAHDENLTTIPVKMCQWTTPILAVGDYAIAINPIHVGDEIASQPEILQSTGACSDDDDAHTDNNDPAAWTAETDSNFQTFQVAAPVTPPPATTQAPDAPVITAPVGEFVAASTFNFTDSSPVEGEATWYKLYIQDADGLRINVGVGNWFKHLVAPELACTEIDAPTVSGSARECEITLNSTDHQAVNAAGVAASATTYQWWVRGYNGDTGGATGAWSGTGNFISDNDATGL